MSLDMTADRSSRMNSEAYSWMLSAQIQQNAVELIGWCSTVQVRDKIMTQSILQKQHKSFSTKRYRILFNFQISHLI